MAIGRPGPAASIPATPTIVEALNLLKSLGGGDKEVREFLQRLEAARDDHDEAAATASQAIDLAVRAKAQSEEAATEATRLRQALADERAKFDREAEDRSTRLDVMERQLEVLASDLAEREARLKAGETAARVAAEALAYLQEDSA